MSKAKRSRHRQARERLAEERRARQVRERRRRVLVVGAAVVAVLALVGVGVAVLADDSDESAALAEVKSFSVESNHVQGRVDYPQTPPAGGPHNPAWLNCGVYDEPVPNENAVHSLEHGAVWITYQPNLPADQIDELRDQVESQTFMLLSPYNELPAPVVASAWGKQLSLNSATDPRLAAFIREYRQGPQTPEPGAPCTGGVGSPQ